jgi:hypothetical protein
MTPSPQLSAATLAIALGLSACQPAAIPRQRLDIHVLADGRCTLAGQPAPCEQAGRLATAQRPAAQLSIVLFLAPEAPAAAVQAVNADLREQHIIHVQYGDPSTQRPVSPGSGLD